MLIFNNYYIIKYVLHLILIEALSELPDSKLKSGSGEFLDNSNNACQNTKETKVAQNYLSEEFSVHTKTAVGEQHSTTKGAEEDLTGALSTSLEGRDLSKAAKVQKSKKMNSEGDPGEWTTVQGNRKKSKKESTGKKPQNQNSSKIFISIFSVNLIYYYFQ